MNDQDREQAKARIMDAFGVTQDDLDAFETATGYEAARKQAEAEEAWFRDVYIPAVARALLERRAAE